MDLRPWLLEINLSPSLTVDDTTDKIVKRSLMKDIVDLTLLNEKHAQDAKNFSATDHGREYFKNLEAGNFNAKAQSPKFTHKKPTPTRRIKNVALDCCDLFPETVGDFNLIFPVDSGTRFLDHPPTVGSV